MSSENKNATRPRFPDVDPWQPDELHFRRRNLPHLEMSGALYFVTFRAKVFLPETARDIVMEETRRCHEAEFELFAAVVMPDHVHLIFRALGEGTISRVLRLVKGRSAKRANELLQRTGPLWMDESFDHIVRNETELEEKFDYILQNPVKKGLVTKPCDYRWLFVAPDQSRHTG